MFFKQLVQYGTTTLNIEVVLGRQSPSFSLKLLRRMISIAKKADERMRQVTFSFIDLQNFSKFLVEYR